MGIIEKEKYVFIFVESDLRWKFFKRFHKSLKEQGYEIIYITICLSVWIKAKLLGYKVMISDFKKDGSDITTKSIEKEILEVESGDISTYEAAVLLIKWGNWFSDIAEKYNPEVCFIYNGTSIFTYAAKNWAGKYKIKSVFFEIANIDGKMFIDPWGTNAKSKLYTNISLLDKYKTIEESYAKWLEDYRTKPNKVQQALVSKKPINVINYAINQVWFSNYLDNKYVYMCKLMKKFIHRYKLDICKKDVIIRKKISELKPYYLFPMQVSIDSQVLLNSDVSLRQAIKYVMYKSEIDGVKLLIKKHPAERDRRINQEVDGMQSENVFILNNEYSLMDLIDNAEKIITINSTVGLEAILQGKNVEFLGRSIYDYFSGDNKKLLSKYVMDYLVDIDYFSSEEISRELVDMCLKRADV